MVYFPRLLTVLAAEPFDGIPAAASGYAGLGCLSRDRRGCSGGGRCWRTLCPMQPHGAAVAAVAHPMPHAAAWCGSRGGGARYAPCSRMVRQSRRWRTLCPMQPHGAAVAAVAHAMPHAAA
eukprot:gene11032-4782_t